MVRDEERQPLLPNDNDGLGRRTSQVEGLDEATKLLDETTWKTETKLIAKHSIPLIGTYLLQYFYNLVIVLVCSRLSTEELAAASLGISTTNIVGYAIFEGMATALDTLCAQAYGAGNPQMVGIHMLRFTVFIHLVAIPIGALWLFAPQILPHLVPQQGVAQTAGTFMRWSLISIPGYASFEAGKRFMQAQGNFTSGLLVLLACIPINIFLNWLFVFQLDYRIAGAALAAGLTNAVRPFLLFGYATLIDRATLQCWPAKLEWWMLFVNWKPMVGLAVPGAIMTLSEWMAFEILTFATSYAGTAALAAQTFLATGAIVVWHLPFAASVVTSTRLGQLIGGGFLETAKKVSGFYVLMFVACGLLDMAILFGLLEFSLHHLTTDVQVRAAMQGALPFAVIFTFFDCIATCAHGIVRGVGWQSMAGWISVLGNYLYAVPLALLLELGPPHLGLRGLWMSIASGLALIDVVELSLIKIRSWDKLVEEANQRQEG